MAHIHGHIGLKMVHKIKGHKVIKYKRLSPLYFLATLSFEGVVPYGAWGFPDLHD